MDKLNNIVLFQNQNQSFGEKLYKHSKLVQYKKGTSPFSPQDLLKYFYIVMDGKVKTYQINLENNKEQTIFIYKRGDMFDTISLLDENPHEVIYEVFEDCNLLQIPIQEVKTWLKTDIAFSNNFFRYLAQQMRYTETLAIDISIYETKDRLINLLIDNLNPRNHFKHQLIHDLSNTEI